MGEDPQSPDGFLGVALRELTGRARELGGLHLHRGPVVPFVHEPAAVPGDVLRHSDSEPGQGLHPQGPKLLLEAGEPARAELAFELFRDGGGVEGLGEAEGLHVAEQRDQPLELLSGLVEVTLLQRHDPVDLVERLEGGGDVAGPGRVEDVLHLVPLQPAVHRVRLEPGKALARGPFPLLERADDLPLGEPFDAPQHLQPGLGGRTVPGGLLGPRGEHRKGDVKGLGRLGPLLEPGHAPGDVRPQGPGIRRGRGRAGRSGHQRTQFRATDRALGGAGGDRGTALRAGQRITGHRSLPRARPGCRG